MGFTVKKTLLDCSGRLCVEIQKFSGRGEGEAQKLW